jgi:hypothetical protein
MIKWNKKSHSLPKKVKVTLFTKIHVSLIVMELYGTISPRCKIFEQRYYRFIRWKSDRNKSCIYWKVMKLFSCECFDIKASCHGKVRLNFLKFEIRIFQITSDGKTTKIRVVDPEKFWNTIVGKFFILNHLAVQNYVRIFIFEIQIL